MRGRNFQHFPLVNNFIACVPPLKSTTRVTDAEPQRGKCQFDQIVRAAIFRFAHCTQPVYATVDSSILHFTPSPVYLCPFIVSSRVYCTLYSCTSVNVTRIPATVISRCFAQSLVARKPRGDTEKVSATKIKF